MYQGRSNNLAKEEDSGEEWPRIKLKALVLVITEDGSLIYCNGYCFWVLDIIIFAEWRFIYGC